MENGGHEPEPPQNGRKLDWPTLVLIAVTGGGNFLANQQSKSQLSYEQQEALVRIRELHAGMEDFENRQKLELEQLRQVMENQQRMLENQAQFLKELQQNDEKILNGLKKP
jgi:hypothetical protein